MCGRYHLSYKKRLEIDEFLAIVDRGNYRAPGYTNGVGTISSRFRISKSLVDI